MIKKSFETVTTLLSQVLALPTPLILFLKAAAPSLPQKKKVHKDQQDQQDKERYQYKNM